MYILHDIQSAVDLKAGLRYTITHWPSIAAALKESPRRRPRQQTTLELNIAAYDKLC
jgi:hypothetical protein